MTESHEEAIKRRAHQIWEEEGRPHGRHEEHWRRALEDIARQHANEPPLPGGIHSVAPVAQQQAQFAAEDHL